MFHPDGTVGVKSLSRETVRRQNVRGSLGTRFGVSEQESSEAGAKKAYATLVRNQGSKVNCFNLTFFFNRVYTFAASAIASIQ